MLEKIHKARLGAEKGATKTKKPKKRKQKRIYHELSAHQEFLTSRFREEWDQMQKTAKREKLIAGAKAGGKLVAINLLKFIAVGGIMTVALVAPNLFVVYDHFSGRKQFIERRGFEEARYHLSKRTLVKFSGGKDGFKIKITEKGKIRALRDIYDNLRIRELPKWDGWWWVVIFDIPEPLHAIRDAFREKLRLVGFYKLQHSVFASPYPCDKELGFLLALYDISPHVHIIKTKYISATHELKNHFGLPLP